MRRSTVQRVLDIVRAHAKDPRIAGVSTLSLGALLAGALDGCCMHSACGCEGGTTEIERPVLITEELEPIVADGELTETDCQQICGTSDNTVIDCYDIVVTEGVGGAAGESFEVTCFVEEPLYCEGRRHALVDNGRAGGGPSAIAAWLARAAAAEAASVLAFDALAEELAAHGAPAPLVRAAREAAGEEEGHARAMHALADRAGASTSAPRLREASSERRALFEIALENAVEGCVNETFAALMALHQSKHASDHSVRDAMAEIAVEEVGHAELAWEIHAWAADRLGPADAARLRTAMREAAIALEGSLSQDALGQTARARLGLPTPARATSLARALRRDLWH